MIHIHTVNSSIAILIGFSDHLIDLIISQLLANGCHDMTELSRRDETIVITVENLSGNISLAYFALKNHKVKIRLTLNASLISSSESVSFIFLAIMVRNSANNQSKPQKEGDLDIPGKSMVPLLSASTSLIMSCNSDSEGFWPKDLMTVPNSLVVICPTIKNVSHLHVSIYQSIFCKV